MPKSNLRRSKRLAQRNQSMPTPLIRSHSPEQNFNSLFRRFRMLAQTVRSPSQNRLNVNRARSPTPNRPRSRSRTRTRSRNSGHR